jgi:hypothetical protein
MFFASKYQHVDLTSTKNLTTNVLQCTPHSQHETKREGANDRKGNGNGREVNVSKMADKYIGLTSFYHDDRLY